MPTEITKEAYGQTSSGQQIHKFTLKNSHGLSVEIINFGGCVVSINVPDKKGKTDDVVTGYDSLAGYEGNTRYFGALIGRVANRICKGQFTLDGKKYQLAINNGPNALHGGPNGYHMRVWDASIEGSHLELKLVDPDGEEHYPGQVNVVVTYKLTDENELVIDYSADCNKDTIINLTNHSYFNLAGHSAANVYDHTIMINADSYTPKDEYSIPTGEIAAVNGSPFDLRTPAKLGDRIPKIVEGLPGYDHNFCVNGTGKRLAARLEHGESGRIMEVYTDQPGIQFYTGNYLNGIEGKGGVHYQQHSALCLETQCYPDAINHSNFPSCVLKPGEKYSHSTTYKFIIKA